MLQFGEETILGTVTTECWHSVQQNQSQKHRNKLKTNKQSTAPKQKHVLECWSAQTNKHGSHGIARGGGDCCSVDGWQDPSTRHERQHEDEPRKKKPNYLNFEVYQLRMEPFTSLEAGSFWKLRPLTHCHTHKGQGSLCSSLVHHQYNKQTNANKTTCLADLLNRFCSHLWQRNPEYIWHKLAFIQGVFDKFVYASSSCAWSCHSFSHSVAIAVVIW